MFNCLQDGFDTEQGIRCTTEKNRLRACWPRPSGHDSSIRPLAVFDSESAHTRPLDRNHLSLGRAVMAPKRQVEKVEAKTVLTAVLLADSFTQVCGGLNTINSRISIATIRSGLSSAVLEHFSGTAATEAHCSTRHSATRRLCPRWLRITSWRENRVCIVLWCCCSASGPSQ